MSSNHLIAPVAVIKDIAVDKGKLFKAPQQGTRRQFGVETPITLNEGLLFPKSTASEPWSATDDVTITGELELAEAFGINATVDMWWQYFYTFSDGAALNEGASIAGLLTPQEVLSYTEGVTRQFGRWLSELLTITQAVLLVGDVVIADNVTIGDTLALSVTLANSELIGVTEALNWERQLAPTDTMALSELSMIEALAATSDTLSASENVQTLLNAFSYYVFAAGWSAASTFIYDMTGTLVDSYNITTNSLVTKLPQKSYVGGGAISTYVYDMTTDTVTNLPPTSATWSWSVTDGTYLVRRNQATTNGVEGFDVAAASQIWTMSMGDSGWAITPKYDFTAVYVADNSAIYKLDPATGAQLATWNHSAGTSQANIRLSPDETVLYYSISSTMWAFDANTGTLLWSSANGNAANLPDSMATYNYIISSAPLTVRRASDGAVLWSDSNSNSVFAPLDVTDDEQYIVYVSGGVVKKSDIVTGTAVWSAASGVVDVVIVGGEVWALGSDYQTITRLNLLDGSTLGSFTLSAQVSHLFRAPDQFFPYRNF